jgi:hypothetical protein
MLYSANPVLICQVEEVFHISEVVPDRKHRAVGIELEVFGFLLLGGLPGPEVGHVVRCYLLQVHHRDPHVGPPFCRREAVAEILDISELLYQLDDLTASLGVGVFERLLVQKANDLSLMEER